MRFSCAYLTARMYSVPTLDGTFFSFSIILNSSTVACLFRVSSDLRTLQGL
jgi:hypothetical protein